MIEFERTVLGAWCIVLGAGAALAADLPAGYLAVDYIVASSGAYIDTGYKPNQNSCTMMDVTVQGTGFYYTLRGSGSLEGLDGLVVYGPELCGANGKVSFSEVKKPSAAAGFFSIGVSETRPVTDNMQNDAREIGGGIYGDCPF